MKSSGSTESSTDIQKGTSRKIRNKLLDAVPYLVFIVFIILMMVLDGYFIGIY